MKMVLVVGLALSIPSILNAQDWREMAQAEQQDSTTPEASLVQQQGPQPVIGVPALAPETPPPWRSFAEKPLEMFAEPSLSNRDAVVEWSDWSDEKKLLVVIAVGVGLLLIL